MICTRVQVDPPIFKQNVEKNEFACTNRATFLVICSSMIKKIIMDNIFLHMSKHSFLRF